METVLKVNNISKVYSKIAVVNNINMNIKKGDIYGFIGKNGAGKTTLIKMIVGLTNPTSGSLELFNSSDLNAGRRKIGTVIESPSFYPNLSAKDNMLIQCKLLGPCDLSIIDETLNLVGLGNIGKEKVKKFSLGMKQRLGIAMSLMGKPEFLVLDEPTNGLDPEGIVEVRNLLKKLNKEKGITILISSHILGELSKLATRYGIIDHGKMIEEFDQKELEERCKSSLVIVVNDVNKASEILRSQLNTQNYTILNSSTIELNDFINSPGTVNSLLSKNDIIVESISLKTADLEDYFMQVIGGAKNG